MIKKNYKNTYAPITLFVYERLSHTQLVVEALLKNIGAEFSDLIIFSDAPSIPSKKANVEKVRSYLSTIKGFKSIKIYHRPYNYGLSKSIIDGVSDTLKKYGRIIVIEDDLVTSPYFLTYMNEALNMFEKVKKVASIHGYVYPHNQPISSAFFLRGADCWGWATWSRSCNKINLDGRYLLNKIKEKKLIYEFDFEGSYTFSSMLKKQIIGLNDSWAIRWHASMFLANKLTLYPGRSLVNNIGNDTTGTHSCNASYYKTKLANSPIDLSNTKVQASEEAYQAFISFFYKNSLKAKVNKFLYKFFRFLSL